MDMARQTPKKDSAPAPPASSDATSPARDLTKSHFSDWTPKDAGFQTIPENDAARAKSREDDRVAAAGNGQQQTATISSGWHYSTDLDKIHNTTSIWNQLDSDNSVEYGFPYGNQKLILAVRKRASDGTKVYVWMHKGQLVCDTSNGCPIKVKFNTSPPMTFTGWLPGDYSSDCLFLEPHERFIAQLRKSKSVVIEIEFYQHGSAQYEFTTTGFEWDVPKPSTVAEKQSAAPVVAVKQIAAPEKPKSKMAICNEKTKGMNKSDADRARSECMRSEFEVRD
jgi:hypothetical protein